VRPKGVRAAAGTLTEPVSRFLNLRDAFHAVRDPCRSPNGSVRPKGDPCRMPNGSMRPKGGTGTAVEATGSSIANGALRDPCRNAASAGTMRRPFAGRGEAEANSETLS
jgi:hypothetical protein